MKKKNYENYKNLNKTMNIKMLIAFILGAIISVTSSYAIAETLIKSADVSYVDNSKLGATNVQAAIDGTCTKFSNDLASLLDKMYPIGSIYISTTLSTPAQVGSAIGGTWASYGVGKTLLSSTTSEQTGGSNTVTLKEANLPAHTHDISHTHTTKDSSITNGKTGDTTSTWSVIATSNDYQGSELRGQNTSILSLSTVDAKYSTEGPYSWFKIGYSNTHSHTVTATVPSLSTDSISTTTSGSTGLGTSFSVQNPYITVYMYKRTK